MKKIMLLLVIVLVFTLPGFTAQHSYFIDQLITIGLLEEDLDSNYVQETPSRVEATILFLRLLGEEESKDPEGLHPFTDVSSEDAGWIATAYQKRYVVGISDTEFGKGDIDVNSYMSLLLKALGYQQNEDFTWQSSLDFARSKELITLNDLRELSSKTFTREALAKITYQALNTKMKGTNISLATTLYNKGKLSNEAYKTLVLDDSNENYTDPTLQSFRLSSFWNAKDWLYYSNASDNETLYRKNKRTGVIEKTIDAHVDKVWISNNYLYTVIGDELFRSDLEGDKRKLLKKSVYFYGHLTLKGNSIAILQNDKIYLYDITSNNLTPFYVNVNSVFEYAFDGSNIYFSDYDGNIYKKDTYTNQATLIVDNLHLFSLFIEGDYLYGEEILPNKNSTIVRINRFNNHVEKLFTIKEDRPVSQGIKYFDAYDNHIYYTEYTSDTLHYRFFDYNLETKEHTKIATGLESAFFRVNNGLIETTPSLDPSEFKLVEEDNSLGTHLELDSKKIKLVINSDNNDYIYFIPVNEPDKIYKYHQKSKQTSLFIENGWLENDIPYYVYQDRYVAVVRYYRLNSSLYYMDNQAGPFETFGYDVDASATVKGNKEKLYAVETVKNSWFNPVNLTEIDLNTLEKKVIIDESVYEYIILDHQIIYSTFNSSSPTLESYDLITGKTRVLLKDLPTFSFGLANDDIIVLTSKGVISVNLNDYEVKTLLDERIDCLSFILSDGQYVYYTTSSNEFKKFDLVTYNITPWLNHKNYGYRIIDKKLYINVIQNMYYNVKTNTIMDY